MSDDKDKKPFDHPDYKIGENAFNFSKWQRENIERPEPRFKVGDVIVRIEIVEVERVTKDCDGSTLYKFVDVQGLQGEYNSLRTLDEMKDFICPKCDEATLKNGKCDICDYEANS